MNETTVAALRAAYGDLVVVVGKQGSTLGVSLCLSSPGEIIAGGGRDCDTDGGDEEGGHDCECENPLESNDLSEELANTDGRGEDAKVKSHGVVLRHD